MNHLKKFNETSIPGIKSVKQWNPKAWHGNTDKLARDKEVPASISSGNNAEQGMKTKIHNAIRDGNLEEFIKLITEVTAQIGPKVGIRYEDYIYVRFACKYGKLDILKYCLSKEKINDRFSVILHNIAFEHKNIDISEYLISKGYNVEFNKVMMWVGHSNLRLDVKERLEYLKLIQGWVDSGKVSVDKRGEYKVLTPEGRIKKITYDECIQQYKTLTSWVIDQDKDLKAAGESKTESRKYRR